MANGKNVFDFNTLSPGLEKLLPYIDAGVGLAFDTMEPRAETYMRQNAPWKDQTANARNGLTAKHDAIPMVLHTLTLFHTMPYGFWLEVRWNGKYAIIGPSMYRLAPELVARVTAAVDQAVKRMPG